MELTDDDLSLEERTRCRLFSHRSIKAIAEHQYAELGEDDEISDELASQIVKLLWDEDASNIGVALLNVLNDTLKDAHPRILAKVLGQTGLVLDHALRMEEEASSI